MGPICLSIRIYYHMHPVPVAKHLNWLLALVVRCYSNDGMRQEAHFTMDFWLLDIVFTITVRLHVYTVACLRFCKGGFYLKVDQKAGVGEQPLDADKGLPSQIDKCQQSGCCLILHYILYVWPTFSY